MLGAGRAFARTVPSMGRSLQRLVRGGGLWELALESHGVLGDGVAATGDVAGGVEMLETAACASDTDLGVDTAGVDVLAAVVVVGCEVLAERSSATAVRTAPTIAAIAATIVHRRVCEPTANEALY